MGREGFGRKGISEVMVTVILVTTVLSVTTATMFFAYANLQMQAEITEFENGKNSMISLAQMIEGLSLTRGAAAYTTIVTRTSGLDFSPGTEPIKIMIEDKIVFEDVVNLMKFRGGENVPSAGFTTLKGPSGVRPTQCLIIHPDDPDPLKRSAPLGWVYSLLEKGACVTVDFGRVRVVPSGVIQYTRDGINWDKRSTVEITYIHVVPRMVGGSDVFNICAMVTNVTTRVIYCDASIVTINVERGSVSESYETPNQGANATLVFLNIVEVKVSVR